MPCWDQSTRDRSRSRAGLLACLFLIGPVLSAQSLEPLARAYRDKPSAATRNALVRFAAAHPSDRDGALALFTVGVTEMEQGNHEEAARRLQTSRARLPQIADYVAFFLASAQVELKDYASSIRELQPVWDTDPPSPLSGRAALVAARAYLESDAPREAITALRKTYSRLPQPDGDLALATAYEKAGDGATAGVYYQLIYYQLPASPQAEQAGAALGRLRESLGASYPPPMPQVMLERAGKLLDAGEYLSARRDYQELVSQLGGVERDTARVRLDVVDFRKGDAQKACRSLESMELAPSEADAERLYYLSACARRRDDRAAMLDAVDKLARAYPQSPWRLKVSVETGNYFLLTNDAASYEPLYRACYETFPSDPQASYCHWKVVWNAYLRRRAEAASLLEDHLRRFPDSRHVPAALYFLGRLWERSGDLSAAKAYFTRIRESFPQHYYYLLAGERLADNRFSGVPISAGVIRALNGVALPERKPVVSFEPSPATRRRIERGRTLATAALAPWAEIEFRFDAKNDPQANLLAMELSETALRRGAYDQAIRYIKAVFPDYVYLPFEAAPVRFWKLAFPLPYRQALEKYARANDLDPYLFAGLIRQESEFNPKVISHANAHGLTQILPRTGRQLTRKLRLGRFRASKLLTPDFNLRLGSYYLRSMLNEFGGKWEPALASYNGGKGRVENWLTWGEYAEPAEFVETIPFTETRNYVQLVFRQGAIYRRLYGNNKE